MNAPDQSSATPPEIICATRRGRVLSAVLVVSAAGVLGSFQLIGLPLLVELINAQGSTPISGTSIQRMQLIFCALGLLGLVMAGILLHHGVMILRHQQTPPNALWLWRDTPVVRGARARRRGWLSIVAAGVTVLVSISLVTYILLTLQQFAPYELRPGVTIIQQKSWQP